MFSCSLLLDNPILAAPGDFFPHAIIVMDGVPWTMKRGISHYIRFCYTSISLDCDMHAHCTRVPPQCTCGWAHLPA